MPRNLKPRRPPGRPALSAPAADEAEAERVESAGPAGLTVVAAGEAPEGERPEPTTRPSGRVRAVVAEGDRGVVRMGGDRKLTKKQQGSLERWRGAQMRGTMSASVQSLVRSARAKFGHSAVLIGSELDDILVGVPCPSLAFEFITQQDCFPLGVVIHLVGEPGSNKSSLLYEFFGWVDAMNGFTELNENETKFSPDLCASLMGYRNMAESPLVVSKCHSVEDWQRYTTYFIEQFKGLMTGTKEEPGPGRSVPALLGTDSIMGKLAEENAEKVAEQGHMGRAHPIEALSINNYMKSVPQMIDGWPVTLVLVNHQKVGRDEMGHEVKRVAGGSSVKFQTGFEISSTVVKRSIKAADFDGVQVKLQCQKNSFGITGRSAMARMLFWDEDDPATGESVQRTVWDWDWATVHLLANVDGRPKARLKEAGFHLETPLVSDVNNAAWSRNLGMTKDDARPWHEVGAMIRKDAALMATLRRALSIKRRPKLSGDYLEILEEQRKKLA